MEQTPNPQPKKLYPPSMIAALIFFVAMIIAMLYNWKAIEDYNTNQYSLRDLATKYNVSYTTIRYAIKGKTWQ